MWSMKKKREMQRRSSASFEIRVILRLLDGDRCMRH
jgi:hypothetical protein